MYDWSYTDKKKSRRYCFSCCWKDVRLKLPVVKVLVPGIQFQLLLKGCTIEAPLKTTPPLIKGFSCCWKDVRLKPLRLALKAAAKVCFSCCWKDVRLKQKWRIHVEREQVSVVVERMYDWSFVDSASMTISYVSVVVERMYDWSLEIRSLQKQFRVSVVVERMYDWSLKMLSC